MKLTPARCPQCGLDADWILETVYVMTKLAPVAWNGETDWGYDDEVLWNSVEPKLIDGKVTLHCVEGHEWLAEMDDRVKQVADTIESQALKEHTSFGHDY